MASVITATTGEDIVISLCQAAGIPTDGIVMAVLDITPQKVLLVVNYSNGDTKRPEIPNIGTPLDACVELCSIIGVDASLIERLSISFSLTDEMRFKVQSDVYGFFSKETAESFNWQKLFGKS